MDSVDVVEGTEDTMQKLLKELIEDDDDKVDAASLWWQMIALVVKSAEPKSSRRIQAWEKSHCGPRVPRRPLPVYVAVLAACRRST